MSGNASFKNDSFELNASLESAAALDTSLWVIAALQDHLMHKVALKILTQKCNKAPIDLEGYCNESFDSLMVALEQQRSALKEPVYINCEVKNFF